MAGGGTFRASRGKGSRGAKSRSLQIRTSPMPSSPTILLQPQCPLSSGTTPQLVSRTPLESATECKKDSGSVIPSDWTEYCPDNFDQEDWEDILKSWMKPEWQKRSKVGSENRKKVPGVEAGTSSYVRHTGGSKTLGYIVR
ncbi:hypothetical protein Tco_1431787, partial [Tanacetum coccineum]